MGVAFAVSYIIHRIRESRARNKPDFPITFADLCLYVQALTISVPWALSKIAIMCLSALSKNVSANTAVADAIIIYDGTVEIDNTIVV